MPPATPLRPRILGAVVLGGMLGAGARAALLAPLDGAPGALALPAATLLINVAGSLALGMLIGALADRRPLRRAFLGTGVLGGFTTYSAFAVQSAGLATSMPLTAFTLVAVSLIAGVAAAGCGLVLGRHLAGRRRDVDNPRVAE